MSRPMNVHETLIFIRKPIDEIAASLGADAVSRKIVDGNEVAYLYEGSGPDRTSFGLSADLDAPEGGAWTHLLASNDDPRVLAALLKQLHVNISQLQPATDWDGNPLVELGPIRKEIERREAVSQAETPPGHSRYGKNLRSQVSRRWPSSPSPFAPAKAAAKVAAKPAAKAAAKPAAKKGTPKS